MDKPTKPTDLIPRSFGGVKNNFSASLQSSGYEDGVPAIYGGDNLNYQLDSTGKELDYCEKICDFINAMPIGKVVTVDENNKLIYDDLAQELPIATTSDVGVVKPDGITITVDNDGTIHGASEGANKDLSNLTATGKTKVVTLAHELDWANAISVATTSSNTVRTYTCPSDGILSICTVVGTGTTKSVQAIIYDTNDNMMFENSINQATSTASVGTSVIWTYLKGETAHYKAYVSGGTTTVIVNFIPFKKS